MLVSGSLILFDLLCHQADQVAPTPKPSLINGKEIVSPKSSPTKLTLQEALKQLNLSSLQQKFENEEMDMDTLVKYQNRSLCGDGEMKNRFNFHRSKHLKKIHFKYHF